MRGEFPGLKLLVVVIVIVIVIVVVVVGIEWTDERR